MPAARRKHPLVFTVVGSLLLCCLLAFLYVYDQVPLHDGPAILVGLPAGAPCGDSEECRAPLGSATRLEVDKVCEASQGGGRCRLVCERASDCRAGESCEPTPYTLERTTFWTRTCRTAR